MRTARTHSSTLYAGVQASLSRSRQISPVLRAMFGWTMGVANSILGGARGYDGGMVMVRSQRPPAESRTESVSYFNYPCISWGRGNVRVGKDEG